MNIHKVAVIGSGVMGGQIAAMFANANIPVLLFGFAKDVDNEFNAIAKLKPAAYYVAEQSSWITRLSYENDYDQLQSCDLVIEAIVERLDIK